MGLTSDLHTPLRTCVGCRQVRPAARLVRCRLDGEGRARCGATSAGVSGRGAWVCAGSTDCFDAAASRGGFARAWKRPVDAPMLVEARQVVATASTQLRELRPTGLSGVGAGTKG